MHELVGHYGFNVAGTSHEVVLNEPFTHKFFRELLLLLSGGLTFIKAFSDEVARRVGRMDFIHEANLAIEQTEFVFGINQNEVVFSGNLSAPLEECVGIGLHCCVMRFSDDALAQDFVT